MSAPGARTSTQRSARGERVSIRGRTGAVRDASCEEGRAAHRGVRMPAGLLRGMCVALLFDAVLAAAVYLTGSGVGLW